MTGQTKEKFMVAAIFTAVVGTVALIVYAMRLTSNIAVPITVHEYENATCYLASKESGVAISCVKKEEK